MSSIKEIEFTPSGAAALAKSRAPFGNRPFAVVRATTFGLVRALFNRLSAGRLRELDDRLLDDIGLTRADLERTFAVTGAFQDPTPELTRAVRARSWRRFARRG